MACPSCRGSSSSCACTIETPDGVSLSGIGSGASPFVVPTVEVLAGAGLSVAAAASGLGGAHTAYTVSLGAIGGVPTLAAQSGSTAVAFMTRTDGANSVTPSDRAGCVTATTAATGTFSAIPFPIVTVTFSAPQTVHGIALTPLSSVATPGAPDLPVGENTVAGGLYVSAFTPAGFTVAVANPAPSTIYRFGYVIV